MTAVHSRGLTFNESTEKIKLVSALDVLRTGLKHLGAVFPIAGKLFLGAIEMYYVDIA